MAPTAEKEVYKKEVAKGSDLEKLNIEKWYKEECPHSHKRHPSTKLTQPYHQI